jgi:integrase
VAVELDPETPAQRRRWSAREVLTFLNATADDGLGLLYRIAVLRGARRGELCGFRWSGTDLDRGVLTVERPVLQLGGKLVESTAKTRAGARLVFLDGTTAQLLREHRRSQVAARMRAGDSWEDHDLVFCQPDGRPWNPDHVSKRFQRLAARAGVPVITLHEARHSAISLMHDAQVRDDIRMREAGHADVAVHQRYNHVQVSEHLAAAEQVAALVGKARGES